MSIVNGLLLSLAIISGSIFGYFLGRIAKSEIKELKKYLTYASYIIIGVIIFYAASLLNGWQESIAMFLSLVLITLIIVHSHTYVRYLLALFYGVLLNISPDILLVGVLLFIYFMISRSKEQDNWKILVTEIIIFFASYVISLFLLGV